MVQGVLQRSFDSVLGYKLLNALFSFLLSHRCFHSYCLVSAIPKRCTMFKHETQINLSALISLSSFFEMNKGEIIYYIINTETAP